MLGPEVEVKGPVEGRAPAFSGSAANVMSSIYPYTREVQRRRVSIGFFTVNKNQKGCQPTLALGCHGSDQETAVRCPVDIDVVFDIAVEIQLCHEAIVRSK